MRLFDKAKEQFPPLEQVSVENIMDRLEQLEQRERIIVITAAAFLVVGLSFFVLKGSFDRLDRLQNRIETNSKTLQEVRGLSQALAQKTKSGSGFATRIRPASGFYLASHIQEQAARFRIDLSNLGRESRQKLGADIEQVSIDVKIPQVTYPKILNLLSGLEGDRTALLRIQRLRIKTIPNDPAHVEASFKVSAFLKKT